MLIVTGCPRSGTSLMMQILRSSLGERRIIGDKYPMSEESGREWLRMKSHEISEDYIEHHARRLEDVCPDGYWEHPGWTMTGVRRPEPIPPRNSVCKIVALNNTDRQYVDKVIYMLRDPVGVARSQVNLSNNIRLKGSAHTSLSKASPTLFNDYTNAICSYLAVFSPQTMVVDLHDLRDNPDDTLSRVSMFLGENVRFNGIKRPGRRPNKPKGRDWDLAYKLADMVRSKNWRGVVNAYESYRNAKAASEIKADPLLENLPDCVRI